MDKKIKNWAIVSVVILAVITGIAIWWWNNSQPGKFDDFAKCLKDKGATFYGAFWCPHCQNQKTAFGSSKKYLPYVECSTQDSNGQLPVCNDANIKAYPTWQFSDGSRQEGELTMEELSKKTECPSP